MKKTNWLNRNVASMSATSFLSDFSHEAVTVILPAFLATMGIGAAALGLIEGASDAASSFTKMGSGYYSDKVGKKKQFSVLGYLLTSLMPIIMATSSGFLQVLFGRVLGWFGRGIRGPPRDAILVESVDANDLGKAFGLHRAGDTLGAICGPVAALVILPLINYREIMWYSVIPAVFAALLFAFFVKDKFAKKNDNVRFFSSMRDLPKNFKNFLLGVGIFGVGDFAPTLLILYATTSLTPEFGLLKASILSASFYIVRNVVYAAASFPLGYLGDRMGRKRVLVTTYLLATICFVGFIFLHPDIWTFVVLFSISGLYVSGVDALEGAVSGGMLEKKSVTIGYGVLGTVNGLGDFVSSTIVGVLWTVFSPSYGFGFAALFSLAGAVILAKTK